MFKLIIKRIVTNNFININLKFYFQENIFSKNGKGGKRGIRVYPSWDKAVNAQAQKTQQWQLNYFLEIPAQKSIEYERADKLYLVF